MNELIKNNPWLVAIGVVATIATGTFFASDIFKNTQVTNPSSPSPHEKVRIQVLNDVNKQPLPDVQVYISSNSPVKDERTDNNGYAEFQAPKSSEKVKIRLWKNGFIEKSFNFDLKGDANQTKELFLTPIEPKKISQKPPYLEKSEVVRSSLKSSPNNGNAKKN
jgi:hypothetical protein